ncbi:chorismate mutase [Terasakiella sp. SH-1]|uniref:chorismate mutase n=1 Tax=Terasakiella sp. SH-1 TaxID=2560057 RepID=UPI00143040B0|nr:chorismate mutase [Terasakiella sp. SH-1]
MSENKLAQLRQEIDRIDDAVHDLLMERAQVVEEVRAAKGAEGIKLRPGREAEVLRRLISRHEGPFPKGALVRIWREVMSAYLKMQGHLAMAVYMPEAGAAYWDLARDQYGSQTPMTSHASVRGVIGAVQSGDAAIGVLPIASIDDSDPWWRHIYSNAQNTPQIVSRLPVASTEKVRGTYQEALIIGLPTDDHTDHERYYTAIEFDQEVSPRIILSHFHETDLNVTIQGQWMDTDMRDQWLVLVEADQVLDMDQEIVKSFIDKIDANVRGMKKLGGYAVPFSADELA